MSPRTLPPVAVPDASPTPAGVDPHALTLRGVHLYRRGLHLVDDLSVTVRPGEVLGISGVSGAGKTTLLRAIGGMTKDYSGQIHRPEGVLSMVFQEPRLLPWRRARKNVQLALDEPFIDTYFRAEDWLERVGLHDSANLYPAMMSGGMRQRVAIARALIVEPSLLLVDEPFSALDAELSDKLREDLLGVIAQTDLITVWVSHDREELEAVSTRRLVLYGHPGEWELS